MTYDTESAVEQLLDANLFDTVGPILISYSRTSITGAPLVSYRDAELDLNFGGEGVTRQVTALGELVTVTLEDVPDAFARTITLVVPTIRLAMGEQVEFCTIAIETTDRSGAFVPPAEPARVLENYQIHQLRGTAQFVVS